ncbi:hypothetical protein HDV05_004995 [Chytridiales sp. JEL 0842]|nr:hypothetical protein HDV05_004995 [Chytridiales sp. JEL 0842]
MDPEKAEATLKSKPTITAVDPNFVLVPLSKRAFILVYIGLALAILLAALDQTIVSTALRAITADLKQQELIAWIGSAYLLTATSTSILYGKLADIFGRKAVIIFAIAIFELGSAICGAATSMTMLIVGRAVAGIGGGGIFSLVLIIISDIVSIQDRGKYQGIIGAVFGIASIIGPLMGGAFSDSISWRWCFYINLPVGVITLVTIILYLNFPSPEGSVSEKFRRIDWLGSFLCLATVLSLITPIQLGGSQWAWNSPQVITLLCLSLPLLAAFVYVEAKVATDPIIPGVIFVNRSVPALLVIAFCLGASFISAIYYISLFFQISFGDSATTAGLKTFPLVIGLVLLSISSGQYVSRYGKYTMFLYVGPVICVAGITLISTLTSTSPYVMQFFYLFIFGVGTGSLIQIRILALQASVDAPLIAVVTAISQFCQTLGGTVGVATTGAFFQNTFTANINNHPTLLSTLSTIGINDTSALLGIRPLLEARGLTEALNGLVESFEGAFGLAYKWILPFACLMFVMSLFVEQMVVRAPAAAKANGEKESKEEVEIVDEKVEQPKVLVSEETMVVVDTLPAEVSNS